MLNAESGIVSTDFVRRMEDHWVRELKNVPNNALRETWYQIAEAFYDKF